MSVQDLKYNKNFSLKDKIVFALKLLHKGCVSEIATEIIELDGVASEEAVAELTIEVEQLVHKMYDEGELTEVKENRQKKRYAIVMG